MQTGKPTESHQVILPQVLVAVSDAILEAEYHKALKSSKYCLVWHSPKSDWEQCLKQFSYDVVVLDLSLFPADPLASIWKIKSLCPETEILVLSDSEDANTAISAFRAGITDYFLKPTSPEALAWAIEKTLRRKALAQVNNTLGDDLRIISAVHHVHISDKETKMREIALVQITELLQAEGALWVWLSGPAPAKLTIESHTEHEDKARERLGRFRSEKPHVLELSFENDLTSRPHQWIEADVAWIPLRSIFLGGVFVHGVSRVPGPNELARMDFLIRNLEIAIENLSRHKEVKQLTYIDDLTGLYNSRYLGVALSAAIGQFGRTQTPFCVLFIDIDRFKHVNDSHGHLVGSQLLSEMAVLLKSHVRKQDRLFRYGGDEFIVLLYDAPQERGLEIAERLRKSVEQKRFYVLGKEFRITISIGVANFPEHGKDRQTLIQMADDAMYNSKKSGRNQIFIATNPLKQKAA